MKHVTNKLFKVLLSVIMCFSVLHLPGLTTKVEAAAGDVPAHEKILTQNADGTYTIALNVTGDSEKQIQKVNVIVIVDRSGSMNTQSGTNAYVPTNSEGTGLYGLVDGEYIALTRGGSPGNRTFWYNSEGQWVQYTGQRYDYDATATRLQATQAAVVNLSNTLLAYNEKEGNPNDTVEMSLVTFATSAQTNINETTSASTYANAVAGLSVATGNAAGTNWEAALKQANTVNFGDSDPTYVIFFSDGAPTFYGNTSGSGQEEEPNMRNSYNASTDDAAALATKVGVKNFYTIFAYGSSAGQTYMTNLTSAAGAPAENNYSASNSAELNAAFAEILESIEMAGIGNVGITDGTTSNVTTTEGEVSHLLTVDESSYKYYRAGGTNEAGTGEKYNSSANGGLGEEWAEAPAATFEGGAVKWNIEGVLENDVTYTVTFDCWPSQETLDIVADIKNDPSSYNGLDENIKKYISSDGSLKTNTSATLSYTDTRTGKSGNSEFKNPDPVQTTAVENLAITKKWENELDSQSAAPITLTVTRDGTDHHTVTLSNNNNWSASTYISIGILRHSTNGASADSAGNKFDVLETGHDFTFTEPADLGYYWELQVPTIRPMLLDGTLTMLILKEGIYNNPDGKTEYTIDGKTYYEGETGAASLTAVNNRRARLNLTKVVDGEDADPTQTFPFTLKVVDSKASEGSADNLNSDYYVWFSVYNGGYVDALVSGATKEITDDPEDMIDETGWTGYYYAPSGTDIVVNLKAGDNLRFLNLPTGSTYTFTEGTLPDNYAFTSSVLTSGTDSTFKGDQTTTGTIVATNTDYQVTYTNTYALSDVEITKVWVDNDDQDGIRPTAEEFKSYLVLKADETNVTTANADKLTVTDNGDNTYTAKWTGLQRFADGSEITYTVEETAIDGYETTGSPANDKGTITNSHDAEVIDITATKVWEDNDNNDNKRNDVKFELQVDGTAVSGQQQKTISKDATGEALTVTWTGLPKYANGEEIAYEVKEIGETDGKIIMIAGDDESEYTVTYEGNATDGFTITNSHESVTTSVKATKIWNDNNNQDGKRAAVKFELQSGGAAVSGQEQKTIAKDATGEALTVTWTGLPKYANGEEVVYTVKEVGEANGKITMISNDADSEYTVAYGGDAATGLTVTNTHITVTTEATVVKVWEDNKDQDGIRPDELVVTLSNNATVTLNEANKWTATVTNLPKYANGQKIVYTWTEGTLPKGYDLTGNETKDKTNDAGIVIGTITTLTNTHTPATITVEATKVWQDNSNQDGKRADVTFELQVGGVAVEGQEQKTIKKDATGEALTVSWPNLPQYANGEKIVYTVKEVGEANGKITMISGDADSEYAVTYTPDTTGYKFTVTNKHETVKINVPVEKQWDDSNNQDGKRPENVKIDLLADGTVVTGKTATVSEDEETGKWTYTWTGLDKYADGEPITYSVKEVGETNGKIIMIANDADSEYTVTYSGNQTDGLVVKNTHTVVLTEATVKKVWNDAENQDNARPDELTVTLSNGATVTLNKDNDWTATVTNLPKYNNGQKIAYTWTEGTLPKGYELTGNETEDKTNDAGIVIGTITTLTNTRSTDTTQSTVKKVWVDADNQDGLRTASVTVQLMIKNADDSTTPVKVNDKEVIVELSDANGWTKTIEGLQKNRTGEVGQEINYTWVETTVPSGYKATYAKEGTIVTVTNTHVPATVNIPGEKTWDDSNNQDGKRPEKIVVNLLADGEKVKSIEVTPDESGNWKYEFKDMPVNKAGKAIVYTVTEEAVGGYTPTISGYNIKNTHAPETVEVKATKVWDDNDNQDGLREAITLHLTATVEGKEVEIEEAVDKTIAKGATGEALTVTWTDLPKYQDGGKEVTYEVTEETSNVITGTDGAGTYSYAVTGDMTKGFTVTNTHTPETVVITISKTWDDADDQDGKRPASVVVDLLGNNEKKFQFTLNEENKWSDSTERLEVQLPKYSNGELISYTVKEPITVEGYEAAVTKSEDSYTYTVTNKHTPELIEIPVEKVWVGDEKFQVIRPEKITVELLADGTATDKSVELSYENDWADKFTGLDKFKAGKEIKYTVKEVKVPAGYKSEISGDVKKYTITNTFTPISFDPPVMKEVIGDEADSNDTFKFVFTALEGAPMPEAADGASEMSVELKAGEEHEYGDVYLIEPGTYKYTITEENEGKEGYAYDTTEYELVFKVSTDENNQLVCELTINGEPADYKKLTPSMFKFVNEYREYVDVTVEKVWDDNNDSNSKRPETIDVTLYANDEEVETVVLSAENEWTYTWEGLEFSDEEYKEIKYTVKENKVPDGYTMTYVQEGNKVTITNTITPPDTADRSNIDLWTKMLAASLSSSVLLVGVLLKKRKEEEMYY